MKHTIGKTTPYPSTPINLQFTSPMAGPIRPAIQSRPLAFKPIRTAASLPRPTNAKDANTSDKPRNRCQARSSTAKRSEGHSKPNRRANPGSPAHRFVVRW
jgi:hypothetical protein